MYRRFQGDFFGLGGGGVYLRGLGYREDFSMENFSWGKKLSMEGAQDFLALFKKKTMKK